MSHIRVLLADDNELVRESLAELLTAAGDVDVVAACTDGDEVVPAAERTHPDVVVLDLAMPRMGGLEAGRRLLAVQPEARVVILTATLTPDAVREARTIGAVGYLLKDDDPVQLPGALRAVAAGGTAWATGTEASEDIPFLAESPFPPTEGDGETE